ncbi:MAG: hypothetical protein JWM82_1915, partial [Myxococcales bacterium]|nr:hypothetical protein [Myxococcales bacterium]
MMAPGRRSTEGPECKPQRRARNPQSGAIAILAGILLTVLMGFAALAFDLSYVRLARLEMKNATDAATHAAMFVLRATRDVSQAGDAAVAIGGRNTVLGHAVVLTKNTDVKFGQWDWDANTFTETTPANAVQVYAHGADPSWTDGTVKTTFGNILGISSANVAQTGNGSYRPRTTMFEADITGSLMQTACGIDQAINAEIAFGQAMKDAGVVKDRLGLDVFVGDATAVSPIDFLNTKWSSMKTLWQGDNSSAQLSTHTSGLGMCQKIGLDPTGSWGANCGNRAPLWPNLATIGGGVTNPSCWQGDFHYAPTTTV